MDKAMTIVADPARPEQEGTAFVVGQERLERVDKAIATTVDPEHLDTAFVVEPSL
jgi:hypothetical protein